MKINSEDIRKKGIVAVIRNAKSEDIKLIVESLYNGGINIVEITMETPNALKLIKIISQEFKDDVIVGAGTVLDPETAKSAIMSGAQFIFSPTINEGTIRITKRYGIVSIPGALTPTEILNAYECGADIIKIFPAGSMGPNYIKGISGPLPHIPLMPTGGINLNNIKSYVENGSVAVGIGSSLVDTSKCMDEDYLNEIKNRSIQFVEAVAEARLINK